MQKVEDNFFIDIGLWVNPSAGILFELSIPTEAVITHCSSNLIRFRPNILWFAGGSPFERSSGGRFYVQYESVPWYLRSPQRRPKVGADASHELCAHCSDVVVDTDSVTHHAVNVDLLDTQSNMLSPLASSK